MTYTHLPEHGHSKKESQTCLCVCLCVCVIPFLHTAILLVATIFDNNCLQRKKKKTQWCFQGRVIKTVIASQMAALSDIPPVLFYSSALISTPSITSRLLRRSAASRVHPPVTHTGLSILTHLHTGLKRAGSSFLFGSVYLPPPCLSARLRILSSCL